MATPVLRFARAFVGPVLLRWLRPTIEGRDQVPGAGGVILAPNHRSNLDIVLTQAISPRPVAFLGKQELAQQRGLGPLLLQLGLVPVDRGTGDLNALGAIAQVLIDGNVVGVFPEGTRSPDGRLHRFRSGVARLAAQAQVPVVPMGMMGTAELWPRGQTAPRRRPAGGEIAVRFGAPLEPPGQTPKQRREFTSALEDAVAALSGQARAGKFAEIKSD